MGISLGQENAFTLLASPESANPGGGTEHPPDLGRK